MWGKVDQGFTPTLHDTLIYGWMFFQEDKPPFCSLATPMIIKHDHSRCWMWGGKFWALSSDQFSLIKTQFGLLLHQTWPWPSFLLTGAVIGLAVGLKCYACVDCAENGLQVQDCTNILGLDIKSDHCIKTVTNTGVSKLFRVLSPSGRENSQAVYIKVKVATLQSETI